MEEAGAQDAARRRLVAWWVTLLGLVTLASRLPYFDTTLSISDSARYALALERYDVTAGRPHPPGNPLYVGLLEAFHRLTGDTVLSLPLVSALAGALAVVLVCLFVRDLAGRRAGWIAAAGLATSPLFWFFGSVGMPATCEAALSVGLAWACYRSLSSSSAGAFALATLLMAAGFGVRSTFVILVAPLWIWAAWRQGLKRAAPACAVVAASWIGWTLLVAVLSGGWQAYAATNSAFFRDVVIGSKILHGGIAKIPSQIGAIIHSAAGGFGLFLIPLCIGVARLLRRDRIGDVNLGLFFLLWAGPSLIFHGIYDWAPRFGVFFLPPGFAIAGIVLAAWGAPEDGGRPVARGRRVAVGVCAALALNVASFTLLKDEGCGRWILGRNRGYAMRDALVRQKFDPARSILLANDSAFHLIWFLPEYEVVGLYPLFRDAPDAWAPHARFRTMDFEQSNRELRPAASPFRLRPGVDTVVLYDQAIARVPLRGIKPVKMDGLLRSSPVPPGTCMTFGFKALAFEPCEDAARGKEGGGS